MKKLLITGGSHAEYPVIKAAQEAGWFVISTGNNEGALGHETADKYVKGDFSDKEFVYDLAKAEKVDAIISGANDFAYLSAAYACEKLGLPGHDSYETSKIIHIKNNFRSMTESIGIKTPKVRKCASENDVRQASDELAFPVMVKPVDLTGGKGVKVCNNAAEALSAFSAAMKATRENYVIMEQFISGSAHGTTCLIRNQKVVWYIIDNEQYGINKYLVLGACSPSDISHHAEFSLIRDIEKVAQHLKLVDGLFHTQFIIDETGYPVMIDPCRRMPGDLYILLAKYTTGVDYPAEIRKAECGEPIQDAYHMEHNFVIRECIMTDRCGVIKDVHIEDELKAHTVYTYMPDCRGVMIDDPMKFKAGIVIAKFDTYEYMMDVLNRFSELAWIEFEE